MGEGLELPADIGEYKEPRIEYYNDHNQVAGKEVTVAKLIDWVTGGGHGSMYTKNLKIDPELHKPVVYYEGVSVQCLMETQHECEHYQPRCRSGRVQGDRDT